MKPLALAVVLCLALVASQDGGDSPLETGDVDPLVSVRAFDLLRIYGLIDFVCTASTQAQALTGEELAAAITTCDAALQASAAPCFSQWLQPPRLTTALLVGVAPKRQRVPCL